MQCRDCSLVFLDQQCTDDDYYARNQMLGPDFFAEARRPAGTYAEQLSAFRSEWGLQVARRLEFVRSKLIGRDVLDFGSGHGQFLQAAQPLARSVTGVELEEQVREIYAGHGIRLFRTLQDLDAADDGGVKRFDVITAFHVLEHLRDPLAVLRGLGDHLAAQGRLVVEVPNADDALLTIYQCPAFMNFYYVGHLYLFNAHTLRLLAQRAGFEVDFIRGVQRWPLSNTLYWLSRGEPGGHQHWGRFLDNELLQRAYADTLAACGATDTLIAQLSRPDPAAGI